MQQLPKQRGRLEGVDLMRGAACLAVVLFHSLEAYQASSLTPLLAVIRTATSHGWLGVHVFFALSGWCIAERLAAAITRGEKARHFLFDRLLRIFPTYWAALILLLVMRLAAQPFNHTPIVANLPSGASGWIADLFLINPYLGAPATLMVSWSLVYELGFYGLAAVALALAKQGISACKLIGSGLLLCGWSVASLAVPGALVLGLWPGFFCGVIAWWSTRHRSATRRAIGLSFFALFALLSALGTPGLSGPAPTAALVTGCILFATASLGNETMAAFRPIRALLALGASSYSVYLVHVTIMSPFQNLVGRYIPPSSTSFILVWLGAIVLGILGGVIFYHQVELRCERLRKRMMAVRFAR